MAAGQRKNGDSGEGEDGARSGAPRPRRQARRQADAQASREGAGGAEETERSPSPSSGPTQRDPFEASETIRTHSPFAEKPDDDEAPATIASFDFVSLPPAAPPADPDDIGVGSTSAVAQRIALEVANKAGLVADRPLPVSGLGRSPVPELSLEGGAPTSHERSGSSSSSMAGPSPVDTEMRATLDDGASSDFSGLIRPWEDRPDDEAASPPDARQATTRKAKTESIPPAPSSTVTTTFADMPPHADSDQDVPTAALGDPDAAARKAARALQGEAVDFYMGGYHVHRRLGQGGMAVVFLARPDGGKDDVVLKRIRPSLVQEERYVKLFMREARIASSLDHDNVVRILDHAEEEGEYYIVMEFLDGIDLRDLADRSWSQQVSLPLEPVLRSLIGAARGLDYAHHKLSSKGVPEGLVHRDVSPENLFVTRSGVTKVLDFGIAKGNQHVEKLTRTGEVKGKVPYLAPEQILGKKLDGRCDLFALGVTAYWLLTATRPFDGTSNFMTIKKIIEDDPKPVTLLNPFIPETVEAVVLKALAKERKRRFARCADFADALEELLRPLPHGCDDIRPMLERAMGIPRPRYEPFMSGPVTKPSVDWEA